MHHARQLCLLLLLTVPLTGPAGATPPQPSGTAPRAAVAAPARPSPAESSSDALPNPFQPRPGPQSPPAATTRTATAASAAPCDLPVGPLPTATRAVIVLDTSGSMRGIGDGQANIFGKVKDSIATYVHSAQPDQLELITFDSGLRTRRSYALPGDQVRFDTDLRALQADGRNTYLYRSLQAALTPLTGADRYLTNVFVLTDGIDNDRRRTETARSAVNAFRGRGPLDTLTYIALGTQIPADARDALNSSDYATGLTLPVGQVPTLARLGTHVQRVTDAAHVPVPFRDGTTVTLASNAAGVGLTQPLVQGGEVALHLPARLPHGTPALLCSVPNPTENVVFPRSQRLLLDLNVGKEGSGLLWLNPGADLTLAPGEAAVLRYRALNGTPLDGAALRLPPTPGGINATLEHQPGAHEFAVRLVNTGTLKAQILTPQLQLGTGQPGRGQQGMGRLVDLPSVTLQPGNAPAGTPGRPLATNTPATTTPGVQPWRWLLWLLPLLALCAAGWWFLSRSRRKTRRARRPLPTVSGVPAPTIQGIEYRDDRTLALVSGDGDVSSIAAPLGGPFDLGRLARVPLLSGLRAEQQLDGLKILNIPGDLEVSQGGRLIVTGDEIRPGTLLGVEVARQARAPHAPLGSLVGLGLPLTLKPDGVTLHIQGPYGTHALTLQLGVTDLGDAFNAPAFAGLKFSTSGPNILLADVPDGMTLTRQGESAPLRPGTYLSGETVISIPTNE
ncbi:vWA domain-containing protein [Deinococcus cavernae]|uniref:vWA domain-containing protein n=1 Tax=Deinococcus cavernae TaxID=2320857 RepID=UPI0011C21243|nr:vWA domain-containing protein [Deinococcus cavernae]